MSGLQPEVDELDTEVHSQWQQQVVPWYGFFSFLGYLSQIPIKIQINSIKLQYAFHD